MTEKVLSTSRNWKMWLALLIIVFEIILLIYLEAIHGTNLVRSIRGAVSLGRSRGNSFEVRKRVCDMERLHLWWNNNISVGDFQSFTSKPCHKVEIDMSSLMPLRDWNGSEVSMLNNNRRSVFIHVCGVSNCLYIDETKTGLAQIMNKRNFEGVTCPSKNASFKTNNRHHTALASFPGSGNTWTRHLLEYISGIFTGGVYYDHLLKDEFKAERYTEKVLAIKTHEMYDAHKNMKYDNLVLLVRSPAECILSVYNFAKTGSHTETAKLTMFKTSDWHHHAANSLDKWKQFHYSWLRGYQGRNMILSYSKLRHDFFNEVFRLSSFLNITLTYKMLWCANINQEGVFHRTPLEGASKYAVFNHSVLEKMDLVRKDVDKKIKDMFGIEVFV